jgi:hypothetical protein
VDEAPLNGSRSRVNGDTTRRHLDWAWAIAGVMVWIVVLVIVTAWAIPVFAQPIGGALQDCSPSRCPTTIEWFPVLTTAAILATIATGLAAGTWMLIRGRR